MKLFHRHIIKVIFLIMMPFSSGLLAQQYAEVQISTDTDNEISIYGESKVTESIQNEDYLVFLEENSNAITGLEIIWREFGPTDVANIQFYNAADPSEYYGYELNNSLLYIHDEIGLIPLGEDFNGEDEFDIIRCNGKIYYLVNNHIIAIRDNISNDTDLHAKIYSTNAENFKAYMEIIYPESCDYNLGVIEENVIFLEPLKTYGIFNVTGPEFKIKYYEKYNTEDGNIAVKIRPSDPSLPLITFPPVQNVYGVNIRVIDIDDLDPGLYWVEVSGMNKGEKHEFSIVKE